MPDSSQPPANDPTTAGRSLSDPSTDVFAGDDDRFARDRQKLIEANARGGLVRWGTYFRMSGPGWLQSAITLGGGSLAASLYLGVLAGMSFLWLQPLAMILGIIMLGAISYVTCSTRANPLQAVNTYVSPVLGWGWLLAAMAANMFWCLPQYGLATGVLQQNLAPGLLGASGSVNQWAAATFGAETWLGVNAAKLVIVLVILSISTLITWTYDSGAWGIKLYEILLKLIIAGIVLCFFGVIFAIRKELNWAEVWGGFIPRFNLLFEPTPALKEIIETSTHAEFWSRRVISQQQDVMIGAAATAVGINMTFLFPYSILAKGWTREFRGLSIFDLATGMFIPFMLAISCVVIASADQFYTKPVPGFLGEVDAAGAPVVADAKSRAAYDGELQALLKSSLGAEEYDRLSAEGDAAFQERIEQLDPIDRRMAAMLVKRSPFDLAKSLSSLTGDRVANLVFGLGVLGMVLSTITALMLIAGFCFCEMFGLPARGWPKRIGALFAATGALGPFVWNQAEFWLAVYVSAFGLMLIPIAYWSFFFLMNQPRLLGADMPRGARRWGWNSLMLVAASVATLGSLYTVQKKFGWYGIAAFAGYVALALVVQVMRKKPTE